MSVLVWMGGATAAGEEEGRVVVGLLLGLETVLSRGWMAGFCNGTDGR